MDEQLDADIGNVAQARPFAWVLINDGLPPRFDLGLRDFPWLVTAGCLHSPLVLLDDLGMTLPPEPPKSWDSGIVHAAEDFLDDLIDEQRMCRRSRNIRGREREGCERLPPQGFDFRDQLFQVHVTHAEDEVGSAVGHCSSLVL